MSGSWSICPACGCVVADVATHGAWHAVLAARLAAADGVTSGAWAGDPVPTVPAPTDVEQAQADADRAALDAITATAGSGHVDGEPWTQPTHALDAYRFGAIVTEDGAEYRSRTPFNTWGPPSEHPRWWERVAAVVDEWDPTAEYWPPAKVTRGGRTYVLIHTHAEPGWDPADPAMHAVWRLED